MKNIRGWMIFDEFGVPETFKLEKGVKGSLVFKTLKQAQKHTKKDYRISKITINVHKYDYNMNITPTKKGPIKTPKYIRK